MELESVTFFQIIVVVFLFALFGKDYESEKETIRYLE